MERVSNHIESILRMYLETVSETWSLFAHPHDWGLAMQIPPSRRHGQQNASLRIDENLIHCKRSLCAKCCQERRKEGERQRIQLYDKEKVWQGPYRWNIAEVVTTGICQ